MITLTDKEVLIFAVAIAINLFILCWNIWEVAGRNFIKTQNQFYLYDIYRAIEEVDSIFEHMLSEPGKQLAGYVAHGMNEIRFRDMDYSDIKNLAENAKTLAWSVRELRENTKQTLSEETADYGSHGSNCRDNSD